MQIIILQCGCSWCTTLTLPPGLDACFLLIQLNQFFSGKNDFKCSSKKLLGKEDDTRCTYLPMLCGMYLVYCNTWRLVTLLMTKFALYSQSQDMTGIVCVVY